MLTQSIDLFTKRSVTWHLKMASYLNLIVNDPFSITEGVRLLLLMSAKSPR